VPKKIRELKHLLLQAGFDYQPAKGSHGKWTHPQLRQSIIIAEKMEAMLNGIWRSLLTKP
jgi:predicted RNA binding protein YcfA (HicA-like mRNA interferase family)